MWKLLTILALGEFLIGCSSASPVATGTSGSSGSSSTGGSGSSTTAGTTGSTTGTVSGTSSGGSTSASTSGSASATSGTSGPGMVVDARDGQSYPTVTIGAQTWLAANLNYAVTPGSYCYAGVSTNCASDGRLYTFAAAASACPAGWHLASDAEWMTLETTLGMSANQLDISGETTPRGTTEGTALQMGGGSGFGAKLAGYATGSQFFLLGTDGYFWTSTQDASQNPAQIWRRHVDSSTPYLYRFENPPASFAISVRCLLD